MMTILFFLTASSPVLFGRPHQHEVRTARIRSNATTVDDNKVTVIFCLKRYCYTKPPQDCYCCLPTDLCYKTESDCRASCPNCNPKCPA
ncbi:hypothetical protein SORBI_3001G293450 [Sorghum bicolor]|uniref:Bowman-Birk serine protease inhibitors family domain-containing protein n=1 Tax=Sorghum bicolor TaxID=4558 RepID=A0A1Z5S870_SORBI|nr:hypothetical protein SORBI_3001G293450 [Sorghum bicolor]OQU92120.1 hypothetical protein SORBI_3001G293450 [Sorghum bicolor]